MSKKHNRLLKNHVYEHYRKLYEEKIGVLPGLTGRYLAHKLHYPLPLLDFISDEYWDSFLPCGNLLPFINPQQGDRLLNLGSGGALDSFALVRGHSLKLTIVNFDLLWSIIKKAHTISQSHTIFKSTLHWVCGDGDHLPFKNYCFDRVFFNGVFNLFPDKVLLVNEINRVLKPQGIIIGAELCTYSSLPDYFFEEPDAWAWCMSGALTEKALFTTFEEAGFKMITHTIDNEDDLFSRIVFSCSKR